ncbi:MULTISPECIES: SRPBCC family protein [Sphingobium]|uniref:SRPBCC family protein n=1 Tax=Sphingobium sp. MI1205 TaxID=407020 RepID=UPI0007705BB8|nr:SRPBCC family protein [Sphingobium sp. MI1205]AMK20472.1 alcohol dehydrogenase zinc-binding domain-containing protein [Sphingobium sp. MI1205]
MPTVRARRIINAPVAEIWQAIRDFGTHSRWIEHHPEITLEGGDGLTIGVKRRVTYGDGSYFDEVLTGADDRNWVQEYDVVGDLPLPVYNVFGAMQLYPVNSEGPTLVERRLTYDTPLPEVEARAFEVSRLTLLASSLDGLAALFE